MSMFICRCCFNYLFVVRKISDSSSKQTFPVFHTHQSVTTIHRYQYPPIHTPYTNIIPNTPVSFASYHPRGRCSGKRLWTNKIVNPDYYANLRSQLFFGSSVQSYKTYFICLGPPADVEQVRKYTLLRLLASLYKYVYSPFFPALKCSFSFWRINSRVLTNLITPDLTHPKGDHL